MVEVRFPGLSFHFRYLQPFLNVALAISVNYHITVQIRPVAGYTMVSITSITMASILVKHACSKFHSFGSELGKTCH